MTVLVVLSGIIGVGILMVFSSIFNGYALSVLWGWFIVPTFGAPSLDVVPAIGISMVVSYLTYQIHSSEEEEIPFGAKITRGVTVAIMKPLLALFFGWIVHLFM